ncbi:MAG: hypothetical protein JXR94_17230 [Candidatus Hydrogenedentes bacterium]|nr:hypothetical protein [Candidatus Hydrogenedentota bacterium]
MDLFAAAQLFLESNFGVLPVLEGDRLVGQLRRRDMLMGARRLQRAVAREMAEEGASLKAMQHPESIQELQRLTGSQKKEQLAAVLSRRHHMD